MILQNGSIFDFWKLKDVLSLKVKIFWGVVVYWIVLI